MDWYFLFTSSCCCNRSQNDCHILFEGLYRNIWWTTWKILYLIINFEYYLQKIVLINFCKPPSKLWRSSQTFTLFLAMMFVSLTIVIVISLYILTQWVFILYLEQNNYNVNLTKSLLFRMSVSKTCGPFRNHIYMFHVLRGDILKLQEVRSRVEHLSRHSHFPKSYLYFSESFLVAIDHVPCSTSCNWTSFADFVVTDCLIYIDFLFLLSNR